MAEQKEMMSRRLFLTGAAAIGTVAVVGMAGCAQEKVATDESTGDSTNGASSGEIKSAIYEVNVTPVPHWHFGNPGVEMDPNDPDKMCFVCTATTPWENTWHFSMGQAVFYSTDRGDTWTQTDYPFGVYPGAGVATLSVDRDGVFYLHNNSLRAPDPKDDRLASKINPTLVSTSSDGGKTWSEPAETPFVTTGHPHSRVDKATGKFYAVGAKRGQWQLPLYVSVTSDKGKTFSEPQRFPYPTRVHPDNKFVGYPGNNIAVHAGILATGYQESITDSNVDEYTRFTVSRDDGKTWEDFAIEVPDRAGVLQPAPASDTQLMNYGMGPYEGSDPLPYVAADPSKEGRFAVLTIRDIGKLNNNDLIGLNVYTTDDTGKTWRHNQIIANDACRPWIEFGENGVLGVVWRTHHVHCYAAISHDHGETFSCPLRFNAVAQPVGDSGTQSDYWSRIAIDDEYVHVGWADSRTGGALSAIYGRAPLSAFQPLPPDPIPLTTREGTPLPHVDEVPATTP